MDSKTPSVSKKSKKLIKIDDDLLEDKIDEEIINKYNEIVKKEKKAIEIESPQKELVLLEEIKEKKTEKTEEEIFEKLIVLDKWEGHLVSVGKTAGKRHNKYWRVYEKDDLEKKDFYVIYCEPNSYVFFSPKYFESIMFNSNGKKKTWYINAGGYATCSSTYLDLEDEYMYMHQIVQNGETIDEKEKINKSVDHINRNKLDNRIENLRWATQSEQNQNRDKRARQKNAKNLPGGITQSMLPIYITYYNTCYDKKNNKSREYFCVEGHPALEGKRWESTKSEKVPILEKLEQAKTHLNFLNGIGEGIKKKVSNYPPGIYLAQKNGRGQLILDKRLNGVIFNLKMMCKEDKTDEENYEVFRQKIVVKYPDYTF